MNIVQSENDRPGGAEEKERRYEKEKTEVEEKEDKKTKAKPNLRPALPPPWSKYFSKNSLRA